MGCDLVLAQCILSTEVTLSFGSVNATVLKLLFYCGLWISIVCCYVSFVRWVNMFWSCHRFGCKRKTMPSSRLLVHHKFYDLSLWCSVLRAWLFQQRKNLVREKLYGIARRAYVPRLMGYLSRYDLIGDVIVWWCWMGEVTKTSNWGKSTAL